MAEITVTQLNLNHTKLAQDDVARKIAIMNVKTPIQPYIFCMQENHYHAGCTALQIRPEQQYIVQSK